MKFGHTFFRSIVAINLLIVAFCYFNRNNLPSNLREEVLFLPQITKTTAQPFLEKAKDKTYAVVPKAEYKINAVVLNRHIDTRVIAPSIDRDFRVVDLCLTWGKNLANGSYKQIKMKSFIVLTFITVVHLCRS